MVDAMHAQHLGSFKSISLLQGVGNVIYRTCSSYKHPLCRALLNVISISKTRRGIICLAAHTERKREEVVFVITVTVSWVPPTKKGSKVSLNANASCHQ